jgi:hypothetical protein
MVAAAQHLAANTPTWVTEHTIESLIAVGVVVLSVLAFARLRGSGSNVNQASNVLMIGLDAASIDFILASLPSLPSLKRLIDSGSLRPRRAGRRSTPASASARGSTGALRRDATPKAGIHRSRDRELAEVARALEGRVVFSGAPPPRGKAEVCKTPPRFKWDGLVERLR